MTLKADLGVAPWDVLHDGIRQHTPLSFGGAVIFVGVILVLFEWALGLKPGPGTIANMAFIGVFEDLMLWGLGDFDPANAGLEVALLVGGVLTIGLGSALYIGAEMGAGPRDGLMVLIAERRHVRVGIARAIVEGSALLVGIALGGAAGVGTIVFALGIGPAVDLWFRAFGMGPSGGRLSGRDGETAKGA
jgi:uncharacterized membrane protein YczE